MNMSDDTLELKQEECQKKKEMMIKAKKDQEAQAKLEALLQPLNEEKKQNGRNAAQEDV